MNYEFVQKRVLALMTLPLWLIGSYLTYSASYVFINIVRNNCYPYPGPPVDVCHNWLAYLGFAAGVGLLLATAYAFVRNRKKESKKGSVKIHGHENGC